MSASTSGLFPLPQGSNVSSNDESDGDHWDDGSISVTSDDVLFNYCVPPRCRLCTFPIEDQEMMVASRPDSCQISRPFENTTSSHGTVVDYYEKRYISELTPCPSGCAHHPYRYPSSRHTKGYHVECYNYAGKSFKHDEHGPGGLCPSPEFLEAVQYGYEQLPSYDLKRRKRVQEVIAAKLRIIWSFLPYEICLMISQHLVREYTIGRFDALWPSRRRIASSKDQLWMRKPIWALYIDIGGVEYIYDLKQTDETDKYKHGGEQRDYRQILDPATSTADTLYVLEDHLGVRSMVLSNSQDRKIHDHSTPAVSEDGTWWRVISPLPPWLYMDYDDLKLRKVYPETPFTHPDLLWSVQVSPSRPETGPLGFHNMAQFKREEPPLTVFQMVPFQINGPDITGYSFCWSDGFLYLHTHHEGDGVPDIYRNIDNTVKSAVWIHLAMEPDEYIFTMWFRHSWELRDSCFWIRTSKDREVTIGPSLANPVPDEWPGAEIEWDRVLGPLEDATPVWTYFNLSQRGIKMFVTPTSSIGDKPDYGPDRLILEGFSDTTPAWLDSSQSLTGLVEIIPYRRMKTSGEDDPEFYSRILGLCLVYSDGRKSYLGQTRFDLATSSIEMRDVTSFHIAVKMKDYFEGYTDLHYVTEIRLSPPSPGEDEGVWRWIHVDLSQDDQLEWYFYGYDCMVAFGEQDTWDYEQDESEQDESEQDESEEEEIEADEMEVE
ncbi:hypothetical protein QBC40DRAFT_74899 [Triangularia verruculosa]|uniref:Uncharacterized protein n=1 Tax=Triangularia verruculosa TaxID=2587418 RepID=A0AAN6XWD2_9PEZI|nr:hypothetical protein QBC40DRAFT_74899 [Triangularia verruculosa]